MTALPAPTKQQRRWRTPAVCGPRHAPGGRVRSPASCA